MSQATILCRATADLGSHWLTVVGAPGAWRVESATNHLESLVNASLKEELARDWTFTDRALDDAISAYVDSADHLETLGLNSHTTILCPEGPPVENRWTTLHRVPVTGAIIGTGTEGRFRPQMLKERVTEWFVRQQWRSFQAPRIAERHEPLHQQPHRPRIIVNYSFGTAGQRARLPPRRSSPQRRSPGRKRREWPPVQRMRNGGARRTRANAGWPGKRSGQPSARHAKPTQRPQRRHARPSTALTGARRPEKRPDMTRQIPIKGFRIGKDGKIVRDQRHLDVSARLHQKSSKRIKPARKGQTR